jgi:hypothetical protein
VSRFEATVTSLPGSLGKSGKCITRQPKNGCKWVGLEMSIIARSPTANYYPVHLGILAK